MAQIDITDPQIINRIVSDIELQDSRDRKEREFKAFEVFSGKQKFYTEQRIKQLFPKSWSSMRVSDISISKKIVRKVSKAYKQPPKRLLEGDVANEALGDIYKNFKFNKSLKEFDQLFNLHKYAALWVNWREENQSYELMPLAPYEFDVVRDQDTGEVDVFILNYPDQTVLEGITESDGINPLIADKPADSALNTKVYAMWSRDHHVVVQVSRETVKTQQGQEVKLSVDYVPIKDNPDNINPLAEFGLIPMVFLSRESSVEYPTPNPLTEQSIDWNVNWSDLLSAAALQGFGQLIMKYPEGSKVETLRTGLTHTIELPQSREPGSPGTDAQYINPSPDLSGQRETYINHLKMILSEHGIESSQGLESQEKFNSGFDRLLASADVQDLVEDNQELYSMVEQDIYDRVRAWSMVLGNPVFRDEEKLSVIYPKPKVLISDQETLKNIRERLDLGLIEKFEALIILDPNLDPQQAKDKLEKIQEEKQARLSAFMGTPKPENANENTPGSTDDSSGGQGLFGKKPE